MKDLSIDATNTMEHDELHKDCRCAFCTCQFCAEPGALNRCGLGDTPCRICRDINKLLMDQMVYFNQVFDEEVDKLKVLHEEKLQKATEGAKETEVHEATAMEKESMEKKHAEELTKLTQTHQSEISTKDAEIADLKAKLAEQAAAPIRQTTEEILEYRFQELTTRTALVKEEHEENKVLLKEKKARVRELNDQLIALRRLDDPTRSHFVEYM
ncbi:hypothetical protein EJ04DRAFT_603808 [Polyplosphaeria fusca]|uniref:Uncharacterized protein n=1 Tax=Polyplosphaeria fusca TaxID=682080 RepID=A0A9P4QZM6_9PLEO|nr:hypothetical protein EJ04DRAFT_603808 [Polyplosphaeria fusca]